MCPPWPNGQGVGPLIRSLRAQVPQGVLRQPRKAHRAGAATASVPTGRTPTQPVLIWPCRFSPHAPTHARACTHAFAHTQARARAHARIHGRTHARVHARKHARTNGCKAADTHMHASTHACAHTHTPIPCQGRPPCVVWRRTVSSSSRLPGQGSGPDAAYPHPRPDGAVLTLTAELAPCAPLA